MDTIDRLPDFIQAAHMHINTTKPQKQPFVQTNTLSIFYTKESPLSNFHPSQIDMGDRQYNCVEQYLSHKKALLFSEPEIAEILLGIEEPREQKRLVRNLGASHLIPRGGVRVLTLELFFFFSWGWSTFFFFC